MRNTLIQTTLTIVALSAVHALVMAIVTPGLTYGQSFIAGAFLALAYQTGRWQAGERS